MCAVHGYVWAHCCDDITIVECNANHFTLLMPHELVAGDLDTTIVPVMADWLQRYSDVSLERVPDDGACTLFDDEDQAPPPPPPDAAPPSVLHAAPAEAVETVEAAEAAPAPAPVPAPYVLPCRPARAASWLRAAWAGEEHLPVWAEDASVLPDAAPAGNPLAALPDLDLTAGRVALGLNDLSWTSREAPTVVFFVHDFLDGAGERWSPLVFGTQLPVFGLHAPPGLQAQFAAALEAGPDAPANASAERIATQFMEAVRSCLPADGANCVVACFAETAALATELSLQLRMRSGEGRNARHAVAVVMLPPGEEERDDVPLSSPAYQAVHARVARASATMVPPWDAFGRALAAAGVFDQQLELVAAHRPPGVARAAWDAEMDHDVRDTLTLFQLAESRMPCRIVSSHCLLLVQQQQVTEEDAAADYIILPPAAAGGGAPLPRKGSFARVLRLGRDSVAAASTVRVASADDYDDGAGPSDPAS